jgi:hypothetical protein
MKETMIRRKDLRGAQTWIGADALISSRMAWRLSGRKISGSLRFVMSSVFEGALGVGRGGRVEKSMDMVDDRDDRDVREEGRDAGGELSADMLGGLQTRLG